MSVLMAACISYFFSIRQIIQGLVELIVKLLLSCNFQQDLYIHWCIYWSNLIYKRNCSNTLMQSGYLFQNVSYLYENVKEK